MKKIVMNFEFVPNDDAITAESIAAMLSTWGSVTHLSANSEIVIEPIPENATSDVIVFISPDDEVPYLLVEKEGDIEGRELSHDEVNTLRFHGVCKRFFANYPRTDRYGAPMYASHDTYAEAEVADHGFPVSYAGIEVQSQSSGDDGSETEWLTIAITESLRAEFMAQ